ncbi:YhgE/Pip domain-containing protein [Streptococcus halichoeri]|uniref:YhgE/Pip domain-containing protein n=1 Tax=Streptococcus halichoeri TaxID=254785 RepID=UPI001356A7F6|nr:YhgE/Pip domain-containing protein [Streptococcus halichoeri]
MFNELKTLLKRPNLWVTIVGIALVPALYSLVFLTSMWNPYGHFDQFPVAVVNQDKEANFQNKSINAGDKIVDTLEKSKELDFHFVSEKTAKKGLHDGKYFMIVTFPKDLSQKAVTILTDHPQKAVVHYETSKGHNFIASKLSQSMMIKMESKISKTVTKTYNQLLFDKLSSLQGGVGKAADGSQQLADGAKKAADGSQALSSNLNLLATSSQTFQAGAGKLANGLGQYTNGVAQLNGGLGQLSNGVNQYTAGVAKLSNGIAPIQAGVIQYTGGVAQLHNGLGSLASGLNKYTGGVAELSAGANQLNRNTPQLVAGAKQLAGGSASMQQLIDGTKQLNAGLNALQAKTNSQDLQTLKTGLGQLQAGVDKLNTVLSQNQTDIPQVDTTNLTTALSDIAEQAKMLAAASANTGTTNANAKALAAVQGTAAYQTMTPEQKAEINAAIQNAASEPAPSSNPNTAAAAQAILGDVQTIQGSLQDLSKAAQAMTSAANQLTQLKSSTQQLASAADQAIPATVQSFNQINTALGQMVPGSNKLAAGVDQLQTASQGSQKLATGLIQYTNGVTKVANGANMLNSQSDRLNAGANMAAVGAERLNRNSAKLTDGVNQLADGANLLNSKSADLNVGVTKAATGVATLDSKSGQLMSGADQLANGAGQIAGGASKLADGGQQLNNGLVTLTDGADTLADKLGSAGRGLKTIDFKQANAKDLAAPIKLTHQDKDNVKVNAVGMAPYMMSIALLVAAMAANIIFYDMLNGEKHQDRFTWAKSKLLINGLISTLAAIILFVTILLMGFEPSHKASTFLIILLTAWALMAVVTALLGWDRRFGSFASLFFLLFQLGSSAGTYPLQIVPPIFMKIGHFLPMYYSVAGLRQAMSLTGDIAKPAGMLTLFIIGAMVVGLLIYRKDKVE